MRYPKHRILHPLIEQEGITRETFLKERPDPEPPSGNRFNKQRRSELERMK